MEPVYVELAGRILQLLFDLWKKGRADRMAARKKVRLWKKQQKKERRKLVKQLRKKAKDSI